MLLWIYLVLMATLPLATPSNVLVVSGAPGSHLYALADVAEQLVRFSYNVTLFSMNADPNVDLRQRMFTFFTVEDEKTSEELMSSWSEFFQEILHLPSEDMLVDLIVASEKTENQFYAITRKLKAYFEGENFAALLEEGNFDLIVIDDYVLVMSAVKLSELNIPVIGVSCLSEMKGVRDKFALPSLLNSEPNMGNEIVGDTVPSLKDRWDTMIRVAKLVSFSVPYVQTMFGEDMTRTGKGFMEILGIYDVVFLLDHPVFSYPYLAPPNTFYLGHFYLEQRVTQPLPSIFTDFLANCPYEHTFVVSFGSYIQDIFSIYKKAEVVLDAFRDINACFIIKSPENIVERFHMSRNKVLVQPWLPQKDLLGSGKVSGFISHCGNNGRLESIFYQVPLLCIPLFADQYHNARLVARNQFGLYLRKEDLSAENVQRSVEQLLEKRFTFAGSMKNAVVTARDDPGAGAAALKFYADLLVKNGNASFLTNKIIKQQWQFEVGNIDFIIILFIVVVLVFCVLLFFLWECLKCCKIFVTRKLKRD